MSKKFAVVGSTLLYLYVAISTHAASAVPLIDRPNSAVNPENVNVANIPTAFVNILFALATMLAVIYLIFGGIRWITSRGDKVGVEAARKHIIAAVIGLVVVLGTFVIIQIVFQFLGANNPLGRGFTLPTLTNPNPSVSN